MRRFLFSLILLSACKPPEREIASNIINIDSLLDAQVKILSDQRIEKSVSVGDSVFASGNVSSPINWKDELQAFREIGQANRPIYGDAYELVQAPDIQSNLMIRTWTAKTELPVTQIKLYYLPAQHRLKRLEAFINMKDFYFSSNRKLVLDFSLLGETNRLESYRISGSQKYFWSAQQNFSVSSLIKL